MTVRLALILATALAPASAFAQEQQSPPAEAKALVESCSARKFETTVEMTVDGNKRGSKITLCGKQGQTDADWANTLKDAIKKVGANETMTQPVKDQIITALNTEIAKIEAAPVAAGGPPIVSITPPASPEYATLPPIPPAPVVATIPPPAKATPARPRLSIECSTPGEGRGGPCLSLERDTLLTIRADEDLAAGASLRFIRRGDVRGEILVAAMRRGQSLRSKLPSQVCSGVATSRVEIQIIGRGASATGANQAADTLGPYPLRC